MTDNIRLIALINNHIFAAQANVEFFQKQQGLDADESNPDYIEQALYNLRQAAVVVDELIDSLVPRPHCPECGQPCQDDGDVLQFRQ